jgi:hypothetical protein
MATPGKRLTTRQLLLLWDILGNPACGTMYYALVG